MPKNGGLTPAGKADLGALHAPPPRTARSLRAARSLPSALHSDNIDQTKLGWRTRRSGCGKHSRLTSNSPARCVILRPATRNGKCFNSVSAEPKDRPRCTLGFPGLSISPESQAVGQFEIEIAYEDSHPEVRKRASVFFSLRVGPKDLVLELLISCVSMPITLTPCHSQGRAFAPRDLT